MSRLLIDENLPFSLVRLLSVDCVHASEIAAQASDTLLWNTARQNNWMVLTRDTDFFDRLLVHGAPPKVIWVRLGNVRKNALIELLLSRWPAMQLLLETNDLVEVYHDRLEALSFPQPSGTA